MVATFDKETITQIVSSVSDPEIPILSIADLGILREVCIDDDEITVVITPTYVGCPAIDMIGEDIRLALAAHDYENVTVKTVLSPAWTTDWLSQAGRDKLLSIGIAPPSGSSSKRTLMSQDKPAMCPRCNSKETECVSEFGSTACKALYRCRTCLEPFDYFKCI